MSRICGSIAIARAIATRCFMPPESVCGKLSANFVRPTLSMKCSARSVAAFFASLPLAVSANTTLSRTVFHGRS